MPDMAEGTSESVAPFVGIMGGFDSTGKARALRTDSSGNLLGSALPSIYAFCDAYDLDLDDDEIGDTFP
jgi:hypothetical protein